MAMDLIFGLTVSRSAIRGLLEGRCLVDKGMGSGTSCLSSLRALQGLLWGVVDCLVVVSGQHEL